MTHSWPALEGTGGAVLVPDEVGMLFHRQMKLGKLFWLFINLGMLYQLPLKLEHFSCSR